jgi:capsular exopolysaccharide synthesis family protein
MKLRNKETPEPETSVWGNAGFNLKHAEWTKLTELDYPCTEALNTLCTNLSFSKSNLRSVLITSSRSREGKSFISVNLMRTMVGLGKSVVLIDADMRRSAVIAQYGVQLEKNTMGLAHYLAEQCEWEATINQTNIEGAYAIFHGQYVINSLALLTTQRLPRLISQLERAFDMVLIDAPPIGLVIDAAEIAKSCDGALFVVSNNLIPRREMIDARLQIEKTGCPILGAVLNKVTFETHSAKKHYYRTYYSHYTSEYYKNQEA